MREFYAIVLKSLGFSIDRFTRWWEIKKRLSRIWDQLLCHSVDKIFHIGIVHTYTRVTDTLLHTRNQPNSAQGFPDLENRNGFYNKMPREDP